MNLAMRILGVAILVAAVSAASFGAYQVVDTEQPEIDQPAAVHLEQPGQTPVTVLAGGETSLTIPVNNTGQSTVNVTLSSDTDGFTLSAQPGTQTVPADQTLPVRASISAADDLSGSHDIDIVATDNATGEELDRLAVDVSVTEPQPPTLSLTSVLPGAVPGQNVTVKVSAENLLDVRQEANLTLSGAEGTVQPSVVTMRGGGTGSATAPVDVPSDASGTLSITIEATAGSKSNSQTLDLPIVASGEAVVDALDTDLTVAAGEQIGVPVTIVSNLDGSKTVNVSGEHLASANFSAVQPGEPSGGFATLEVPEDAPSSLTTTLRFEIGDLTKSVDVEISTELDGQEAQTGLQAKVDYVGRLTDDRVFDSSLTPVVEGPFEKAPSFRARPNPSPITVRLTSQGGGTIPGFQQAIENMTEGESRTVTLPPNLAYGPARQHENISATTEIDREREIERANLTQQADRSRLPEDLNVEDVDEGEVFTYQETRLLLKEKTDSTVTFERYFEKGEKLTLYPSWPNSTELVNKNSTHIVLETNPPQDAGQFTWESGQHKAQWENATTVKRTNSTTIVLQHAPEEGLEYTIQGRRGSTTHLVENVDDSDVHISSPNQNPLGGKTLVFDVHVLELEELEQRQPRMPTGR
jgi:FKBP-type peptidyl-prolyl cis-trans isomerase 2